MNEIDFDDASKCWRANKKCIGKGYFVYKCNYIHSNGKRCFRTIYNSALKNNYKYQFNNFEETDLSNHKNANVFCKKHLNRYNNID